MSDESVNPYAPPAEESAAAEIPGVWRVEGDCLVVREGAMLPPVDLDGRGAGGPLTPLMLTLQPPVSANALLFVAIGVLALVGYHFISGNHVTWLGVIGVSIVIQFMSRGVKVRTAPALVFGHLSVPAARAMSRRATWRFRLNCLLLALLATMFALIFAFPLMPKGIRHLDAIAAWGLGGFGLSLVLLLVVAFWSALDWRWRCSRLRDGWVWIKGLGPDALQHLAARAVGYQPVPVKRKVFKMRLDRLPAAFWRQVHGRGLLGALRTWWIKSRTKGPVERYGFHWSEREWLSPQEADPELLEAWRRETAGTPLADWPLVYAERTRSPAGCDQVNELAFLSPDGRHAAIPAITRVVNGRKLREIRETNFRSFTADGRIIATGTVEAHGPFPAAFHYLVAEGDPMHVAQAHFQHTSAQDLVRMDAAELRRREELEMQLRHEAMEAAGIYGPIEEMEFTWP